MDVRKDIKAARKHNAQVKRLIKGIENGDKEAEVTALLFLLKKSLITV